MSGSPRPARTRSRRATATAARAGHGRFRAQDAGEFDFAFHALKKTVIEHLGQLDFLHAKRT